MKTSSIPRFEVLVGNVGVVVRTYNEAAARQDFADWAASVRRGSRGDFPVILMQDGEPIAEVSH